jgi:hypothetical protein
MDFELLTNRKTIIKELFDRMDKTDKTDKIIIITKLLKHLRNDYTPLVNKPSFWKFMFEIGNEYYDDDEKNFYLNHSTPVRSLTKMTGCYYNSQIILKDGSFKEILFKFPQASPKEGFPFIFKINCMAISPHAPFYLHVKIVRINKEEVIDQRKVFKGISCMTTKLDDVYEYFPSISPEIGRKQYCVELIFKICDLQLKTAEKIVFTPFEK